MTEISNKIRSIRKVVRCLKIKFGLKKEPKVTEAKSLEKRRSKSSPKMLSHLASGSPLVVDKAWRDSVNETCRAFDEIHERSLHKRTSSTMIQLNNQNEIYRQELIEMRKQIQRLKAEKSRLNRALQTRNMSKSINSRNKFIKCKTESRLTPVKEFSGRRSRPDSAYVSAEASPNKIFPLEYRQSHYLTNGTNTFFIAL